MFAPLSFTLTHTHTLSHIQSDIVCVLSVCVLMCCVHVVCDLVRECAAEEGEEGEELLCPLLFLFQW